MRIKHITIKRQKRKENIFLLKGNTDDQKKA